MKTAIRFEVLGEPFGKQNMQPIVVGGHARAFLPKKSAEYMTEVVHSLQLTLQDYEGSGIIFPPNTPVKVNIFAFMGIPKSHYKFYKKLNKWAYDKVGSDMLEGKVRPTKKPDCDNLSKIICDGITKVGNVWGEDSQVVEEHLYKYYGETPKVVVEVIGLKEE